MKQTFAGKTKCDPASHDRPFIVEWDATDTSSFEARAKSDVLFVKYEGCELRVLDGCRLDSTPGALGSYRAPEWTSGSVEVMEIADEGDLYAKLPLGAASLGGRVQGGEKFRMEYFVAGTRTATRDAIYRSDLKAIPACAEATHFVYGYNLGAFALGASTNLKGEVGGTVWGFGAGASRSHKAKADKTGGQLGTCRGESAKEVESCKAPIRLTLRPIDDGTNPDAKAMLAPETATAKNLAGKLKIATDREKKAADHAEQARLKLAARDGKGCLAELDVHDKLDPRPIGLSTNPKTSSLAMLRGQCLMLAGQCGAGKQLYRKWLETTNLAQMGPEVLDSSTDGTAATYCQGSSVGARDRIAKASQALSMSLMSKKDPAFCQSHIKTLKELIPKTPPKDEDDRTITDAPDALWNIGPMCLEKAGDCEGAFQVYAEVAKNPEFYKFAREERRGYVQSTKKMDMRQLRSLFEAAHTKCKK